ncbi:MAG TPA: hypothetical protein VLA12_05720, partial [Planctomycetaceae bacterium]|nr:hypothetical protein [Planctomycetaceae bacterium]
MKEGGGDPKTFDTAFTQAKVRTQKLKEYSDAVKNATGETAKKAAQADFDLQLSEAERMIRLALKLADADAKPADVATCRYFLAYTLYQARKMLDAATVGEYVVLTATEDQAAAAQDAAYLALGALSQLYNQKAKGNRDEERKMMADAAQLLAERWPESARADDAHLILGDVHRNAGEPLKAAEYFSKVNETYDRYPEAQLKGGQALWVAYLTALEQPEGERPEQATLDKWVADSVARINDGIARIEKDLSKDGTPPDIYTASKVTLAEILNSQGKEPEALKVLLEGDHSVIKHIAIEDETQRPDVGPKSRPFAIQAYQLLLRSYMGTEAIDAAIDTMNDLERVAGTENPEALTNIYIQLGVKLREEIERLQAEGNQARLTTVVTAFDRFLGALFNRTEGLNANTLFWISESYANLGSGMQGDSSAAANYFSRAGQAYQKILDQTESNPGFLDAKKIPAVKSRIAVLERR